MSEIKNYDEMTEEEKEYFEKSKGVIHTQVERVVNRHSIDSETMPQYLDQLMDNLEYSVKDYLVEGATLTCSRCTDKKQTFIHLGRAIDSIPTKMEERCKLRIVESRKESINNLLPANILDVKGGLRDDEEKNENVNIVSLGNCKQIADNLDIVHISGQRDVEEVIDELEKGRGTCYCTMDLNEEWENMPLGYDYVTNTFISSNQESYFKFNGKEGINMMSILFCKRGGIITAQTSGQIIDNSIDWNYDEPDASDTEAVKRYMWNYFIAQGFSEYAVAGILGNVWAETGGKFNTDAVRGNNNYGLFQQGYDRGVDMRNACKLYAQMEGWPDDKLDDSWKSVRFQCRYALEEYYSGTGWQNGNVKRVLKDENETVVGEKAVVGTKDNFENADNEVEAALMWGICFEICFSTEGKQMCMSDDGKEVNCYVSLQHQQLREESASKIYGMFAKQGEP